MASRTKFLHGHQLTLVSVTKLRPLDLIEHPCTKSIFKIDGIIMHGEHYYLISPKDTLICQPSIELKSLQRVWRFDDPHQISKYDLLGRSS